VGDRKHLAAIPRAMVQYAGDGNTFAPAGRVIDGLQRLGLVADEGARDVVPPDLDVTEQHSPPGGDMQDRLDLGTEMAD